MTHYYVVNMAIDTESVYDDGLRIYYAVSKFIDFAAVSFQTEFAISGGENKILVYL